MTSQGRYLARRPDDAAATLFERRLYYAISDDKSTLGKVRFYTLRPNLSGYRADHEDVGDRSQRGPERRYRR